MREKHPLGWRLLALTAAVCTLGSLAVVPVANAEDGKTPAASVAAAACTPVDTQKNKDSFKLGSDGQGTVVEGFSDTLLASKAACYDVNVSADVSLIADSAFKGQPIGKLTFDEGDVPLSIGANAFDGVTVLKTLEFPARLTAIGARSFQNVYSLATVDFGASQVEKIPEYAFYNKSYDSGPFGPFIHTALTMVKLPAKLSEIGIYGFGQEVIEGPNLTVIWPTDSDTLRMDNYAFWSRHIANDTIDFTHTKLQNLSITDEFVVATGKSMKVVFPQQMNSLSITGQAFTLGDDLDIVLPEQVEDLELDIDRMSFEKNPTLLRLPRKIGRAYLGRSNEDNNQKIIYQVPENVTAKSDNYWDHVYFESTKADKYFTIQNSAGKPIDASTITKGHNVRMYMRSQDDAARTLDKEVTFTTKDASSITILEAPKAPSRTGYTFKGWDIKPDFPLGRYPSGPSSMNSDNDYDFSHGYPTDPAWCLPIKDSASLSWSWQYNYWAHSCQPGQKIAVGAGEYTWTAQWEKATEVKPAEPEQSADGETVTIPSVTGVDYSYVKDDKTVQAKPGEIIVLKPGETVTVTAAPASGYRFPANAQKEWTFEKKAPVPPDGKKFTVTFDSEGGSPVDSQTVEEDKTVTKPADPTRAGYTFLGWTADPEGASDYDFTAKVTKSFTLHARWQKDAPVTPNPPDNGNNGGNGGNGNTGNNGGGTTTPSVTLTDVERFYNPRSGEHFYTAGVTEQSVLRASGVWRDEGVAFRMSSDKGTPVYRLYNPGGKHLFTTSERERDALIKAKWNYEGVAFYVPDGAKTDVHRLYNPGNGDHLLTTSANERGVLVMHKWRDEGIAFKAE